MQCDTGNTFELYFPHRGGLFMNGSSSFFEIVELNKLIKNRRLEQK
jgi:hypothetical protein